MFNFKTVKALRNQRDALVKQNNDLRQQIRDLRNEFNEALEAKETERRELCDQIGELQEQAKRDSKTIQRKDFTIGRLTKGNMWLCCTNSSLADKTNIKGQILAKMKKLKDEGKEAPDPTVMGAYIPGVRLTENISLQIK